MVCDLSVVSINNIQFFNEIVIKKILAFKMIYFVCNSEENKTSNLYVNSMLQKHFFEKIKHNA